MKPVKLLMICVALPFFAYADNESLSELRLWNDGVTFYESGDMEGAKHAFELLKGSKTYRSRAAEALSKIEFEAGNFESATTNAQIAWRADSKSSRLKANHDSALVSLTEQKIRDKDVHEQKLMEAMAGKDIGEAFKSAMNEAAALMIEAATLKTNAAERVVTKSDELADRAEKLMDKWTALKPAILSSITNETVRAKTSAVIEESRKELRAAAKNLADLELEDAYGSLAVNESAFNRFLKISAAPPLSIRLDFIAQSNAWKDVEMVQSRPWQEEAIAFTDTFTQAFPAWSEHKIQELASTPGSTNTTFTIETRDKIQELASELKSVQTSLLAAEVAAKEERALEILKEIIELMPPEESQGKDKSDQGEQEKEPRSGADGDAGNQEETDNDEQVLPAKDEDEREEDKSSREEDKEAADKEDIEAMLKKAEERSNEYEDMKRRMRRRPSMKRERDW